MLNFFSNKVFTWFIFVVLCNSSSAQQSDYTGDYPKEDKQKITELSDLAHEGDSAKFFSTQMKFRRESLKNKDYYLLNSIYDKSGVFWYYKNSPKKALLYFDSALIISLKYGLDELTAGNYMNKGAMNFTLLNYSAALNDYKASEKYMLKIKSPKIGGLLGNISLLYQEIGDLENAKKYLSRSLPFVKLYKEADSYTKALNNLGIINKKEKNYKAADSLFRLCYDIAKKNNLTDDYADVLYNLVNLLFLQKKFEEAKLLNEDLLIHVKKYKDPSWVKLVLLDYARISFSLNNIVQAKKYLEESEKINFNEDALDRDEKNSYLYMAELYHGLKLYAKSSEAFTKYFEIESRNESGEEAINMQQLSYKYEKQQDSLSNAKQKEITELENIHSQEKAAVKLHQQQIVLTVSLIGLFGIIVFALFLVKANRSKEKANTEILNQKKLITEKNKEITDSITYAKRIQHSLLPLAEYIEILLPNYFLLYKPKDIVSGDFFWIKKINAAELFIAVADCTGHGVPGAMMSALSIQNLNELSRQTHSPSQLLTLLNADLKKTLNQDQEGFSKDGLDICLCKLNVKEKKITYSGANRSLLIFDATGLKQEVKATKAGIAGYTNVDQFYEEHELVLKANDLIVLSTDGFADQFGGEKNKKITTKRFKEWIASIYNCENKHLELEKKFLNWKHENDQIDDICVLGFKI